MWPFKKRKHNFEVSAIVYSEMTKTTEVIGATGKATETYGITEVQLKCQLCGQIKNDKYSKILSGREFLEKYKLPNRKYIQKLKGCE